MQPDRLVRVTLFLWLTVAFRVDATGPGKTDFTREILPVLAQNCFKCHGPDAKQVKAGLRLDLRPLALQPAKSGKPAIIAGQPGQSELVRRIGSTKADERMPQAGHPLPEAQVKLIEKWIEEGAEYPSHWAYQPIARPPLPPADSQPGVRSPVDGFILAKLAERNLTPQPPADRVTLIRRLSFDLTGLPPSYAEVAAFVADESPHAYDRLVDRLLASPHFGERMAMHWMDLVRYADSRGYSNDQEQPMTPYRDYLIQAFNQNKPFNVFTAEQLAGDLLPGGGLEQRIASGYNRLLMTTDESGAQPKEYIAKYAADRVRNLAAVWLGSTIGCAECHDHKYDPFSQGDFYSLAAFFADVKDAAVTIYPLETQAVPSEEHQAKHEQLRQQRERLHARCTTQTPELNAAQAVWEQAQRWRLLAPVAANAQAGNTLIRPAGMEVLATSDGAKENTLTVELKPVSPARLTALRLQVTPTIQLPNPEDDAPRNVKQMHVVVTRAEVLVGGKSVAISESIFTTNYFNGKTNSLEGNRHEGFPKTGWEVRRNVSKPVFAILKLKEPVPVSAGVITLRLRYTEGEFFKLARLRVSGSGDEPVPAIKNSIPLPGELEVILTRPVFKRTPAQVERMATHFRNLTPLLDTAREQLAAVTNQLFVLEKDFPRTLMTEARAPREVRVLAQGNWMRETGEPRRPAVPAALGAIQVPGRATRLDLANWLTAPENPLVARVFVNRIWKHLFGQGIVTTSDDFGTRGSPPNQPELLDWLAAEFMRSGWDVKHLVRVLTRTEAYRRSSMETPALRAKDPYNAGFARQSRFRLDAELVRDVTLATSGLLVKQLGGPSARPSQPEGYWENASNAEGLKPWNRDQGESQYRRGLYTYWRRAFLHPSLAAFDAPSREECVAERTRSNTPQQALVLLNDPNHVEAARAFAARILREGGTDRESRIRFACREALSRDPQPEETGLLASLYEKQARHFAAEPKLAEAVLEVGSTPIPSELAKLELAAWTAVARVVLNLYEGITRN